MAKSEKRGSTGTRRGAKAAKKARPAATEGRSSGARGTAPWVARHAEKHAAEARRRNADPIPPGSARATLRVPKGADQIKQRVAELHAALSEIRTLRKRNPDAIYAIGQLLGRIRAEELYAAKGYNSFETFVERELDLGKALALALERIPRVFTESATRQFDLGALQSALGALDEASATRPATSSAPLPLKPPSRKR